MDAVERQEARSLLAQCVAGLGAEALDAATALLRSLPSNERHPLDDDDHAATLDNLAVWCPHCESHTEHGPACLVVRAGKFLATFGDGPGRDDELLDLLLAFVTRESGGYLWGGIYHDGKSWLC